MNSLASRRSCIVSCTSHTVFEMWQDRNLIPPSSGFQPRNGKLCELRFQRFFLRMRWWNSKSHWTQQTWQFGSWAGRSGWHVAVFDRAMAGALCLNTVRKNFVNVGDSVFLNKTSDKEVADILRESRQSDDFWLICGGCYGRATWGGLGIEAKLWRNCKSCRGRVLLRPLEELRFSLGAFAKRHDKPVLFVMPYQLK